MFKTTEERQAWERFAAAAQAVLEECPKTYYGYVDSAEAAARMADCLLEEWMKRQAAAEEEEE